MAFSCISLTCSAQQAISHGDYVEFPPFPTDVTDAEHPNIDQLDALDAMIKEHNKIRRGIFADASTHLIDDGGL